MTTNERTRNRNNKHRTDTLKSHLDMTPDPIQFYTKYTSEMHNHKINICFCVFPWFFFCSIQFYHLLFVCLFSTVTFQCNQHRSVHQNYVQINKLFNKFPHLLIFYWSTETQIKQQQPPKIYRKPCRLWHFGGKADSTTAYCGRWWRRIWFIPMASIHSYWIVQVMWFVDIYAILLNYIYTHWFDTWMKTGVFVYIY